MSQIGSQLTGNPDKYNKHYKTAYGLWIDNDGNWDMKDFSNNYFRPQDFEYSLHLAMKHTDQYVWIFSVNVDWLEGEFPREYLAAFSKARKARSNPPVALSYGRFYKEAGTHNPFPFLAAR